MSERAMIMIMSLIVVWFVQCSQLMRTALHYAMGIERVETISNILIQAGALRVVKDLVRLHCLTLRRALRVPLHNPSKIGN